MDVITRKVPIKAARPALPWTYGRRLAAAGAACSAMSAATVSTASSGGGAAARMAGNGRWSAAGNRGEGCEWGTVSCRVRFEGTLH